MAVLRNKPTLLHSGAFSRKLRRLAFQGVGCILLGLGGLWFWMSHREPSYGGKHLSEWLKIYRQPVGAMAPVVSGEAADAIRHIGTNALPLLVRWIQEPQDIPFWKVSLYSRVYRWNFQHPGRAELLEILIGRQMRPDRALWGFTILGLDARPAIPDLVQIVHSQTNASARYATLALAYLGKDALTPLLNLATNQSSPLQGDAMVALGQMRYLGSEAHPAVKTLLGCLDDPKLGVGAADILGRLHLEGELCVPALARCTESTNQTLRMWGAISLGRFGNPAKTVAAKLTVLLNDPDQDVRDSATNALLIIAPETAELHVGVAR